VRGYEAALDISRDYHQDFDQENQAQGRHSDVGRECCCWKYLAPIIDSDSTYRANFRVILDARAVLVSIKWPRSLQGRHGFLRLRSDTALGPALFYHRDTGVCIIHRNRDTKGNEGMDIGRGSL